MVLHKINIGTKLFAIGIVLAVFHASCYYDVEEELYGICISGPGKFSEDVLPLMTTYCNATACHNSADNAGDLSLETYSQISAAAQNPNFLGSMNHEQNYIAMPMNMPKMDTCHINTIGRWIKKGLKND